LQYVFNKRAKYYKQEVQNFEHAPDIINNVYFLSPEKQSEYKMSDYQEFYRNLLIYSITAYCERQRPQMRRVAAAMRKLSGHP
jgi:Uma2 family endonuclease